MRHIAVLLALGGCSVTPVFFWDTGDPGSTGTGDTNDYEPCIDTEIWVDGPEEPQIGDQWTVLMKCDGAVMTGPMVLQFDPLDFATTSENVVTFVQSGSARMMVQMGGYREYKDVEVRGGDTAPPDTGP